MIAGAVYTKKKFICYVMESGLHIIGKLRVDANLSWSYEGEYKGTERPKCYDGKVNFNESIGRFDYTQNKSKSGSICKNVYCIKHCIIQCI